RLAEWYNLNLLDLIPKVNGPIPLHTAEFDQVEQHLYYKEGARFGRGLLDFLSVAYISAPENPVQWTNRPAWLPFITAGQKPSFGSDPEILRAVTADDFDPHKTAWLPESARAIVAVSNQTSCSVLQMNFGNQNVETDIECAEPSLVVVSQTFYHHWKAYIDGRPVPLLRANLAFQAMVVPAGKHHLKLIYRDSNLVIGAVISVLS